MEGENNMKLKWLVNVRFDPKRLQNHKHLILTAFQYEVRLWKSLKTVDIYTNRKADLIVEHIYCRIIYWGEIF